MVLHFRAWVTFSQDLVGLSAPLQPDVTPVSVDLIPPSVFLGHQVYTGCSHKGRQNAHAHTIKYIPVVKKNLGLERWPCGSECILLFKGPGFAPRSRIRQCLSLQLQGSNAPLTQTCTSTHTHSGEHGTFNPSTREVVVGRSPSSRPAWSSSSRTAWATW